MAPVQEPEVADMTDCPWGARKRFECQVIGLPRPSVRWYKDGLNITSNNRYGFYYFIKYITCSNDSTRVEALMYKGAKNGCVG